MSGKPDATGLKPESYMIAALHGELAWHPWRSPVTDCSDAYSLFLARSSAMGWLADPMQDPPRGGLWATNEAELGPDSGSQPSQMAVFQVSLTESVPPQGPLPVQPFLACVGETMARIGSLDLQAIQVLLPVEILERPPSARDPAWTLIQDAGWFDDYDPNEETPVRVTVDSGQEPAIPAAAPEMLSWIQRINKETAFSCDAMSLPDDEDDLALKPPMHDGLWRGPAHHRATFSGTLAEWSLAGLGWLAAFLADTSFRHGVNTPLMLTARRSCPRGGVE